MSAPKPPSPPKINQFAGYDTDPRIREVADQLGIGKLDSSKDIRRVNEEIFRQDYQQYREDPGFRSAERALIKQGILPGKADFFDRENFS